MATLISRENPRILSIQSLEAHQRGADNVEVLTAIVKVIFLVQSVVLSLLRIYAILHLLASQSGCCSLF